MLYRNNGIGTFTDVTASAGVADGRNSMGAAFGDYDNDGFVDLMVTNYVSSISTNSPASEGSLPASIAAWTFSVVPAACTEMAMRCSTITEMGLLPTYQRTQELTIRTAITD